MATRLGGLRRKSRHKMTKGVRTKGKVSLSSYFQTLENGDQVYLTVEPAIQKGFYSPKYLGKSGIVTGKRGRCYEVAIKDFTKEKTLVVHPVHLKKVK